MIVIHLKTLLLTGNLVQQMHYRLSTVTRVEQAYSRASPILIEKDGFVDDLLFGTIQDKIDFKKNEVMNFSCILVFFFTRAMALDYIRKRLPD